jgi:hypothetical protein
MRGPRLAVTAPGGAARALSPALSRLSRYPTRTAPAVPGQTDSRPRSLTGASGRVSCALRALINAVRASRRAFDRPGIVPQLIQLAESSA